MRKSYISQLTQWARWMLPQQEAEDVITDYCDIVGIQPRSEDELIRDLGKPWDVVKAVSQPKQYRTWLFVFITLVVCVIFPVVMAYKSVYWMPIIDPVYIIFLCLGAGLSHQSFCRNRVRKAKLTRRIILLLALLLIGVVGMWFLASLVLTDAWKLWNLTICSTSMAQVIHLLLRLSILVMVLIALCGLVRARLDNQSWCAVYILGLTGVLLGLSLCLLLHNTNFNVESGWKTSFLIKYALISILGLIGAGGSLC